MRTRPGCSGSLPATGWSSSSPKRRAKATCSARVMSWSRKNSTLCFSSRARISATRSASRAASPRFDVRELGADRAGQRLDPDCREPRRAGNAGGRARLRYGLSHCGHLFSSYRAGRDSRRAAPLSAGFVKVVSRRRAGRPPTSQRGPASGVGRLRRPAPGAPGVSPGKPPACGCPRRAWRTGSSCAT